MWEWAAKWWRSGWRVDECLVCICLSVWQIGNPLESSRGARGGWGWSVLDGETEQKNNSPCKWLCRAIIFSRSIQLSTLKDAAKECTNSVTGGWIDGKEIIFGGSTVWTNPTLYYFLFVLLRITIRKKSTPTSHPDRSGSRRACLRRLTSITSR